jgi:outer membrane protein OmpA-like peptidoglycan-associated protein
MLTVAGLCQLPAAQAQEVKSADDIIKGLQPVKTPGFDPAAPQHEAAQKELNAKLREFKTRQITVEERDQVAKLVEDSEAPNVDMQIFFAFDSADIEPEALTSLNELGKALSNPALGHATFLIAGHTDAKGSEDYNLALSQRRAEAVKAFLVQTYHVDAGRLSAIGFGEEQLKNKDDPFAEENRRVQIVNTGSASVAEGKPGAQPSQRQPLTPECGYTVGAPAIGKRCLMRRNSPSRTAR